MTVSSGGNQAKPTHTKHTQDLHHENHLQAFHCYHRCRCCFCSDCWSTDPHSSYSRGQGIRNFHFSQWIRRRQHQHHWPWNGRHLSDLLIKPLFNPYSPLPINPMSAFKTIRTLSAATAAAVSPLLIVIAAASANLATPSTANAGSAFYNVNGNFGGCTGGSSYVRCW